MTARISNQYSNNIDLIPTDKMSAVAAVATGIYAGLITWRLLSESMHLFTNPYLHLVDLSVMVCVILPCSVIAGKVTAEITQQILDPTSKVVLFIEKTPLAVAEALPDENTVKA